MESEALPDYADRGFRWIRESVELMRDHHKHPLPMAALMFMYAETLGKPLAVMAGKRVDTNIKVSSFVETYLPRLWAELESLGLDRQKVLGDHFRNGLAHEIFMKRNCGIHEGGGSYVVSVPGIPCSINVDMFVAEFLEGLERYKLRLSTDGPFREVFDQQLGGEE